MDLDTLNRRRFIRGAGLALALPIFETSYPTFARGAETAVNPKRLGCIYFPDGVPMPLPEDSSYEEWFWFPHGSGTEFTFTKCMTPLEPLHSFLNPLMFPGLPFLAVLYQDRLNEVWRKP